MLFHFFFFLYNEHVPSIIKNPLKCQLTNEAELDFSDFSLEHFSKTNLWKVPVI